MAGLADINDSCIRVAHGLILELISPITTSITTTVRLATKAASLKCRDEPTDRSGDSVL